MNDRVITKFVKEAGVFVNDSYVIWLSLLSGYILCKMDDNYKTNHKEKKLLSYLWGKNNLFGNHAG
jgi:hypothetical protein